MMRSEQITGSEGSRYYNKCEQYDFQIGKGGFPQSMRPGEQRPRIFATAQDTGPDFTGGLSEDDVNRIIGDPQQQEEERIALDPIEQTIQVVEQNFPHVKTVWDFIGKPITDPVSFTQAVEQGCIQTSRQINIFGAEVIGLANGQNVTWGNEIQPRR